MSAARTAVLFRRPGGWFCGFGAGEGSGWWMVLPGLFVAGLSNGVLNASLGHAAVPSVPPERAAMGSATNNIARYIGSAIGIALVSILISGGDVFGGWRESVLAPSAFSLLGGLAVLALSRSGHSTG